MSVNSVNSVAFTGKTATTKNGNEYKKTNAGKIIGGITSAAAVGTLAVIAPKSPEFKTVLSMIAHSIRVAAPNIKNIRGAVLGTLAATAASVVALAVGQGTLTDKIINHNRAKKADKEARHYAVIDLPDASKATE